MMFKGGPPLSKSPRSRHRLTPVLRLGLLFFFFAAVAVGFADRTRAHPLGNFTVNHFARLEVEAERVRIRYVVDMAEIPAFQELRAADSDGDGTPSSAELNAYLERAAAQYVGGLVLTVDGTRVPFRLLRNSINTPAGAGGLPTLRIECDYEGTVPAAEANSARRLRFEDTNHRERAGWREIVVRPAAGVSVFDSSAFGSGLTDELKIYPQDRLAAPLDERVAELSFVDGAVPAGGETLLTREGRPAGGSRDRLAELIDVPEVTLAVALLGLLTACALGALHALSPGHGKAVVGAYLVGSRGTVKHAAFLGLMVTATHTAGVFALGLLTLFASEYVVPERLFPVMSLVSGGLVLAVGLSLFFRRLRAALGGTARAHTHDGHTHHAHDHQHEHTHEHATGHAHSHEHTHEHSQEYPHAHEHAHADDTMLVHSHGGRAHSHLPPGADGERVTWRSLLALGISGGMLPCPSALVVLLAAVSLGRVGFGLLLVVAFSLGLAATLTGVGLAFVYAGRLVKHPAGSGGLMRALPVLSAFVIACAGAAICYEALRDAGFNFQSAVGWLSHATARADAGSLSTASALAFGFVLGLKHAVEADHMAAVATIVTERKSVLSSSLVGGLWGVGHTVSLLVAGIAVIVLNVRVGERTALALEFAVGLMLVALGALSLRKLARGGRLHLHTHRHGSRAHAHPHLHDGSHEADPRTHHGLRLSARPLLIGMVHGLAGSAALMLLVLSTIPSPLVGLSYIAVFGAGSVGGMMLMSALVGLPVHLTAVRFARANFAVRGLAGVFSLGMGLFMVYEIGLAGGLFR
jgi:ABC-type nickel/cobalt efflux system permease component RcnA